MATQAKMGFVGFVRFVQMNPTPAGYSTTAIPAGSGISVRVTSADIKLSQEISYPDVVDGKIDQTLYQLGPAQVGGSIAFPLVHEGANIDNLYGHTGANCENAGGANLAASLWKVAADRNGLGRLANVFDCQIRYADNLAYTYKGCLVNTMQFTINHSEPVSVSCEVIGGVSSGVLAPGATSISALRADLAGSREQDNLKMLAPARIVTWNDAELAIWSQNSDTGGSAETTFISPSEIRTFTCSINNNIERFYTLNGKLGPQDIAAKKREISGDLTIMGHNEKLSNWTESNESRFTAPSGIAFGYRLGNSATPKAYWATGLYGVVFEIEEVSLQTGLLETKTRWRALGDCTQDFLATKLGNTDLALPLSPTANYGNGSSLTGENAYPKFPATNGG